MRKLRAAVRFLKSGTSVAAPAVSSAVALMLQANPGLTPPLIKAMLQYSAQPIAGANFLQQGAGLLNVDGAVRLAQALRTDLATAINAGTITAGASMLASGKTMPAPNSVINGTTINWSRIVYAGGNQVLSDPALFSAYQPIWDPRLVWVRNTARRAAARIGPQPVAYRPTPSSSRFSKRRRPTRPSSRRALFGLLHWWVPARRSARRASFCRARRWPAGSPQAAA